MCFSEELKVKRESWQQRTNTRGRSGTASEAFTEPILHEAGRARAGPRNVMRQLQHCAKGASRGCRSQQMQRDSGRMEEQQQSGSGRKWQPKQSGSGRRQQCTPQRKRFLRRGESQRPSWSATVGLENGQEVLCVLEVKQKCIGVSKMECGTTSRGHTDARTS